MSENDPGAPKSELPPPLDTLEPRQSLPRTPERDPVKFRGEALPAENSISPSEREARIARIRELQRHPLPVPQHVAAMLSDAVLRKK